ncbi:MAG: BrnT family toxin [Chitinivibrionales bacterium]|nr:BrnT family toxin [Chitinivibrionales bacterium]
MDALQFVWDDRKAAENLKEHKVSFDEALTVFYDENAVQFFDDEHSEEEQRFLMLGISRGLRLLLVSHCHREDNRMVRIISARKATKRESMNYPYHGKS